MDNISRENNNSFLPVAGVIAAAIALLLGGIALAKASKAATEEALIEQKARIDAIETQAKDAAALAARTKTDLTGLQQGLTSAFEVYSKSIEELRTNVKTLQEGAAKKPATAAKDGPVTAAKDEYVVKSGDTGSKIASANGTTVAALEKLNPGIDWTKLKVGAKVKVPAKK